MRQDSTYKSNYVLINIYQEIKNCYNYVCARARSHLAYKMMVFVSALLTN